MSRLQTGQPIDLLAFSKAEAKVGDYKWSHLNETDFTAEHLGQWMLCNGQSCVGTLFSTITGNTSVPNAFEEGAFLRQAKSDRELGSFEGDAIRNITGSYDAYQSGNWAAAPTVSGAITAFKGSKQGTTMVGGNSTGLSFDASRVVPTAEENRPKNIALNLYVKVNY